MKRHSLLSLCILFSLTVRTGFLSAQEAAEESTTEARLKNNVRPLQFTLFDHPSTLNGGYYWPSWQQSIQVTKNMHQISSKLIAEALEPVHPVWGKVLTTTSIFTFNLFQAFLPSGLAWQHQEAHRMCLRHRGITSYNQAYEVRLFNMRVATKRVSDEDLIMMKKDYPAEFNRLRGAGHEGQSEMSLALKKDAFYYGTKSYYDIIPIFANTVVIIQFLNEWRGDNYDQKIDERNQQELTIMERDISGVEFTPYVYDLFRPDEPYDQRGSNDGAHENGGIDRYIGNSDLTQEEADYLRKQSNLAWLCALSPHLFGISRFKTVSPFNDKIFYWNFNVIHNLVSFGHVIDVNLFLKQDHWNLFVNFHNYKNKSTYYPGLDVEIVRYPLNKAFISGAVGMWLQPKDQSFFTKSGTPGGMLKFKVDAPISEAFELSVEADAKSNGWVAGIVSLKPAFQVRTGFNWMF